MDDSLPRICLSLLILTVSFLTILNQNADLKSNSHFPAKYRKTESEDKSHLQAAIKFLNNNQPSEAKTELKIALRINPQNWPALKIYQEINHREANSLEGEIAKTKDILKKRPDYLDAWLKLSLLYEEAGNDKLAIEAKKAAQKLDGNLIYP